MFIIFGRPVVEEANTMAPAFGKIFKEMIIVTDPARPLPRAGKGTVMRKQALQVYGKDIDELWVVAPFSVSNIYIHYRYARVENSTTSTEIAPPKTWLAADIETWLIAQASSIVSSGIVRPYVDVFDQGFDRCVHPSQEILVELTVSPVYTPPSFATVSSVHCVPTPTRISLLRPRKVSRRTSYSNIPRCTSLPLLPQGSSRATLLMQGLRQNNKSQI